MSEFNPHLVNEWVSDEEAEVVMGSEDEELCLLAACPRTQSSRTPGSKTKSSLICLRQGDCSQLPPHNGILAQQSQPGPEFSLLLFLPEDFLLASAMEGFYLFVIFNKKWLRQHGVRLMCPKKQTCSLSGFVFFYCFWNPAFLLSCWLGLQGSTTFPEMEYLFGDDWKNKAG